MHSVQKLSWFSSLYRKQLSQFLPNTLLKFKKKSLQNQDSPSNTSPADLQQKDKKDSLTPQHKATRTIVKPDTMTEDEFLYGAVSDNHSRTHLTKSASSPALISGQSPVQNEHQVTGSSSDTCVGSSNGQSTDAQPSNELTKSSNQPQVLINLKFYLF